MCYDYIMLFPIKIDKIDFKKLIDKYNKGDNSWNNLVSMLSYQFAKIILFYINELFFGN